ncbi:MAG: hypothetical protein ACYCX4_17675 [Bacillota bacterium]
MRKHIIFILLPLLIILITVSGCGQKTNSPGDNTNPADIENLYMRSGQSGNVELEVLWVTPDYVKVYGNPAGQVDPEKNLVFYITMTTHSGDLLGNDLSKLAELRIGEKNLTPSKWEFTKSDAHHPEGVLVFPNNADTSLVPLTLVIKGLGGESEVAFNWETR